jgi:hypothetical protein
MRKGGAGGAGAGRRIIAAASRPLLLPIIYMHMHVNKIIRMTNPYKS